MTTANQLRPPSAPVEAFISYSHCDEEQKDQLIRHLTPLQRDGLISVWHDRKIFPGEDFGQKIDEHLKSASLVLLLVSADFIASPYCYDIECKIALDRHAQGLASVIPVLLRPVDWKGSPIGRLQALPCDGRPVTEWDNRDTAMTQIAKAIREMITSGAVAALPEIAGADVPTPTSVLSDGGAAVTDNGIVGFELTIDQDFNSFTDGDQANVLGAIQKLLATNRPITITQKRKGSVHLTLQLPADEAARLAWSIKDGALRRFRVVDGMVVDSVSDDLSGQPIQAASNRDVEAEQQSESRIAKHNRPGTTYLDVLAEELQSQLESDPKSVAFVDSALLAHFGDSRPKVSRLHALPEPGQPEALRALQWCARLARGGHRPLVVVAEQNFQQAFSQIREMLALAPLPIRLIVVPSILLKSSLRSAGNPSPSTSILAFLRLLPGTVVSAPKDGWELRQLLRLAERGHSGPIAIQLPRGPLPPVRFPDFADGIEIGKAEILEDGNEIAILALGSLVAPAVKAAEALSKHGISAGVVNARFVEPLDRSIICELSGQVRGVVTLEEEASAGGFGTAVLELLADSGIPTPVTVSGAVGIQGNGDADEALVQRIVDQVLVLVDRVNGTAIPVARAPRMPRSGAVRSEIDLFGFSTESLKREQDLVKAHRLSPQVDEFYGIYKQAGERPRYLFQWCEQAAELTTLSCVVPDLFRHVCDTKLVSMMLCVLLDDVADQRGNEAFLELLLRIVKGKPQTDLSGCSDDERRYAEVTQRLTDMWFERLRTYPGFATFDQLLRYDAFQYFNAMRYSFALNRNLWAMNPVEHELYLPHAMDMMSFATTDLMCSVDFPLEELGRLRDALRHVQCMGRVANLLSTWRREIHQSDFASGVFARAVVDGDLSVEQLRPDNFREIEDAIVRGGHERYYFGRWKYHRECFLAKSRNVHGVDLHKLLEGNDRLFLMNLGNRGLI